MDLQDCRQTCYQLNHFAALITWVIMLLMFSIVIMVTWVFMTVMILIIILAAMNSMIIKVMWLIW